MLKFLECPLCQATNTTSQKTNDDRNKRTDLFAGWEGFFHLECVHARLMETRVMWEECSTRAGCGGDGYFLACEVLERRFSNPFPACALSFLLLLL